MPSGEITPSSRDAAKIFHGKLESAGYNYVLVVQQSVQRANELGLLGNATIKKKRVPAYQHLPEAPSTFVINADSEELWQFVMLDVRKALQRIDKKLKRDSDTLPMISFGGAPEAVDHRFQPFYTASEMAVGGAGGASASGSASGSGGASASGSASGSGGASASGSGGASGASASGSGGGGASPSANGGGGGSEGAYKPPYMRADSSSVFVPRPGILAQSDFSSQLFPHPSARPVRESPALSSASVVSEEEGQHVLTAKRKLQIANAKASFSSIEAIKELYLEALGNPSTTEDELGDIRRSLVEGCRRIEVSLLRENLTSSVKLLMPSSTTHVHNPEE
jgi:hypothetical protein